MRRLFWRSIEFVVSLFRDPRRLAHGRDRILQIAVLLDDRIRRVSGRSGSVPEIRSYDGRSTVSISICERNPPWSGRQVAEVEMPGMVTLEERQYYDYLGSFYSGRGEVVELGPWLGLSTLAIWGGLHSNPHFARRKLHVFDDFVWRSSWMDKWLTEKHPVPQRPRHHDSFLPLFDHYTQAIRDDLIVERRQIAPYDGNEALPPLSWPAGAVEMLFVDCGRTFEVNESWFKVFSPFFIPKRTLLVLEDWQTHREVPTSWYNQIKQFTDSKGSELQQIHELRDGTVATFLYEGKLP
jgi:hypothetical protein